MLIFWWFGGLVFSQTLKFKFYLKGTLCVSITDWVICDFATFLTGFATLTVVESGIMGAAGFKADQWYGIVAPRSTPQDIVAKLNTAINAPLTLSEFKTRLSGESEFHHTEHARRIW